MSNLTILHRTRAEKECLQQEAIVARIEELLGRAKAGDVRGVCYAMLLANGHAISIGMIKDDTCGLYEMVGAATILADHMVRNTRS